MLCNDALNKYKYWKRVGKIKRHNIRRLSSATKSNFTDGERCRTLPDGLVAVVVISDNDVSGVCHVDDEAEEVSRVSL